MEKVQSSDLLGGDVIAGRPHVNLLVHVKAGDDKEYLVVMIVFIDGGDNDGDDNQEEKSTPGPLAPPESKRPSRKITARSYSWTTFGYIQSENKQGLCQN